MLSRNEALPILKAFLPPPPDLPPDKAEKLLERCLSARQMRTMCDFLRHLDERGRKLAAELGPENISTKRGRHYVQQQLSQH